MTDLREALERHDYGVHSPAEIHQVIIPAARRFLALTETGRRVEWCEVHDHEAGPIYGPDALLTSDECWRQVWTDDYDFDQLCRTDTRLLIPADYLTEEGP